MTASVFIFVLLNYLLFLEVDFNVILLNSSQYQINKVGNKKRDRRGLILFSPAYIVQVYMGVLSQKCVRSFPNNTDELLVWGNLRYGRDRIRKCFN